MKVHVVGAGGMLGQEIVRVAGGDAVALTRAELDVTDADAVRDALAGSTVINCAAYTDVDGAESDPEGAHAVNAAGARNVAAAAERVLYISTDYVFNGSKSEPYLECDPVEPLSVYGASKAAGERATAAANANHLIVRSSWLFGAGRSSCSWFEFAREILGRAGIEAGLQPCSTEEFPRPARRPAYSVLGSEREGPTLPAWQEGLEAYLGVAV